MKRHQRFLAGLRGEQVAGLYQRQVELMGQERRHPRAELHMGVLPGADRGAADGQGVHRAQRVAHARFAQAKLRRIAAEFLTQSERDRVLQMGAADLDHALERLRLGCQPALQLIYGRQQGMPRLGGHRDVQRAGKRIVARLPEVDLVIGVNPPAAAGGAVKRT